MIDTDPHVGTTPRLSFFVAEGFATGLALVDLRPTGNCPEPGDALRAPGGLWHSAMLRWFGARGLEEAP